MGESSVQWPPSPRLPDPWPPTLRQINDLPDEQKWSIYRTLVPDRLYQAFGIELADRLSDSKQVIVRCPPGSGAVELSVYHVPGARDPVLHLHLSDTFTSQLAVLLVVVNDPGAPRFDVDVDSEGRSTQLGTVARNIPEEIRAMRAGLVPGQVRRGLRIFRTSIPSFDAFVQRMGHDMYFIEPLFYHNAIAFERYGFAYVRGARRMQAIHHDFQPGGSLHARLDGSSPFRQPDAWRTVSGRSWAIHDGILGESLGDLQMVRQIGRNASVSTFPGGDW